MKYCPFCGAGLQDEMKFCPLCGKAYQGAIKQETNASEKLVDKIEPTIEEIGNPFVEQKKQLVRSARKRISVKAFGGMLAFVVLLLSVVVIATLGKDFTKDEKAIQQKSRSVVMVYCYNPVGDLRATGSGFVAYDDSTIVTNYHVVDRAAEVKISTDEDLTVNVSCVIAYDTDKDIAILKTEEPTGLEPLLFGKSNVEKKGAFVAAIGSPLGNKNTVSTGILSGRIYDNMSNLDMLQFSAPISSGSSGGALFNKRGKVIGITSATYAEGQNLNLAIPIEAVDLLYAEKKEPQGFKEVFRSSHGVDAVNAYFNSEFVDFSELCKKPEKFTNRRIMTECFVVVDGEEEGSYICHLFSSEDDATKGKLTDYSKETVCSIEARLPRNCGIVSGYFGHAVISGDFQTNYDYSRNISKQEAIALMRAGFESKQRWEDMVRDLGLSYYLVANLDAKYFEAIE